MQIVKKNFVALVCLFLAACGGAQNAPQNNAVSNQNKPAPSPAAAQKTEPKFNPADTVKFVPETIAIKAGATTQANLKIRINPPYHVNSNPPSEKNFIPLEINFENAEAVTFGKSVYPKGEMKTFEFSEDKPLSVYEGEITVKIPVKADKSAASGQRNIKGKLGFQPCDEQVCYPPQTVAIELPVTVN